MKLLLLGLILLFSSDVIAQEVSVDYKEYFYGARGVAQLTVGDANLYGEKFVEGWTAAEEKKEVCRVNIDTKFLAGKSRNYIYLHLRNNSDSRIIFDAESIELTVGKNSMIRPYFGKTRGQIIYIGADSNLSVMVPLPSKYALRSADNIHAAVPFTIEDADLEDCKAKATFEKTGEMTIASSTDSSMVEVALGFGSSLFKTGNLGRAGSAAGLAVDFLVYIYFHPLHGMYFSISGDNGYGRGDPNTLRPITSFGDNQYPELHSTNTMMGYTYKKYYDQRYRGMYDIGFGQTIFAHRTVTESNKIYRRFSLEQRIGFEYKIANDRPQWLSLFLHHRFIPVGKLDSVSVTGNAFALLLAYKVGLN